MSVLTDEKFFKKTLHIVFFGLEIYYMMCYLIVMLVKQTERSRK